MEPQTCAAGGWGPMYGPISKKYGFYLDTFPSIDDILLMRATQPQKWTTVNTSNLQLCWSSNNVPLLVDQRGDRTLCVYGLASGKESFKQPRFVSLPHLDLT